MNAGTTDIATGSDRKLPYPGVGQLLQAEETIRDPAQKNMGSRWRVKNSENKKQEVGTTLSSHPGFLFPG